MLMMNKSTNAIALEQWESKTLGDIVERIVGGGTPSRNNKSFWGKTIPWATVKDFATFNPYQTQECIPLVGLRNSSSNLIPSGTLITSTRMALGKAVVYEVDVAINQDLKALFLKNSVNVKYLTQWFKFFGTEIDALGSGSTVKGISLTELRGLPFQAPPLSEQTTIADTLTDVDALLDSLDRIIAKKRDLKQAAMQQLLTGQTRLPGFSGEWKVKRLGDLAQMGSGGTPPSSVASYYDGNIPWVSIADMTKGGKLINSTDRNISADGFANSAAQMFPVGTILYAMYASLGECSIAGISLCSSQAILGIKPNEKLVGEFLYYFLVSLKPMVKTLGQQGTQSNLNKGMVQGFKVSLPVISEQRAIVSVLKEMDAELTALEQRRDKTTVLKQGMMQELLTGRTRLV